MVKRITVSFALASAFIQLAAAQSPALDTGRIDQITGMKGTSNLAGAVKKVLETPDRIRSGQATPAAKYASNPVPAESHIAGAPLESILGKKGEANNGMFKVTYGRPIKMHGMTMGDAMGVNT